MLCRLKTMLINQNLVKNGFSFRLRLTAALLAILAVAGFTLQAIPASAAGLFSRVYLGGNATCLQTVTLGLKEWTVNANSITIKFDSGASTRVSTGSYWWAIGQYSGSVDRMDSRGEWATVTVDCTGKTSTPRLGSYTIRQYYKAPLWNATTGNYDYQVTTSGKVNVTVRK